ncbi:MAG: hypothetical protein KF861_15750 [Planctomycetaceae bacterium]|nr:hypothetical protein [Planctomycetaceae bacterium]
MSKPPLPKSLLSAHFDGELSAEERAAVRRAVERNPGVKQVLDDFSQISTSLKSLHGSVPSPQLRDAVLARIQPDVQPRSRSPLTRWQRGARRLASGIAVAAAAGVFLVVWLTRPGPIQHPGIAIGPARQMSKERGLPPAGAARAAIAHSSPSPGAERRHLSSGLTPAADALGTAGTASMRAAALPKAWLAEQYARDQQLPQPGDVINYLEQVAEETVCIPVTVVDVQKAAGHIRMLLLRHGIQPPTADTATAATGESRMDESNLLILVESDWQSMGALMDDLDADGYHVAELIESSQKAQQVMMAQNSTGADRRLDLQDGEAEPDVPAAPAADASGDAVAKRVRPSRRATAPSSGIYFETSVSDTIMEMLGYDKPASSLTDSPLLAESSTVPSAVPETAAPDAPTSKQIGKSRLRKPWDPFASMQTPARVVIVIQKSGRDR